MAEDVQNTIRVVMQRYARNLEEEIADLGLLKNDHEPVSVSLAQFDRDWTPEPPIEQVPLTRQGSPVDDTPVLNLRNPFQDGSVAKPASPTAFLERPGEVARPPKNVNKPN
jgi:hypothetical protein